MNRLVPVIVAMSAVAAVAAGGSVPAARAVPAAVSPAAVTGLGVLSTAGSAEVGSVSCASAGNCAADGSYAGKHGQHAFVAAERNGRWGKATGVPGLAALNTGGERRGQLGVVRLGGQLRGRRVLHRRSPSGQGFVAGERNGRWGTATGVPGLAALNKGGDAEVGSVSCASAGNCAAGGYYADRHGHEQGFVAAERNGRWGKAIEVPGLAALNTGGGAEVTSVSCASAGNCAAGGTYTDGPRARSGVRGRRAERPLGQGDRGARPGGPEHAAGTPRSSRCRAPRRATARPAGTTRPSR